MNSINNDDNSVVDFWCIDLKIKHIEVNFMVQNF